MISVIIPKIYEIMKWLILMLMVTIKVDGAPYYNQPMDQMMNHQMDQLVKNQVMKQVMEQQIDQSVMNQMMKQVIEQQLMEQMVQQNQYNVLQQQLMGLQQLQMPEMNPLGRPVMIAQPIIMILPTSLTKSNNLLDNPNASGQPNLKISNEDPDTVIIDADDDIDESNTPEIEVLPRQAILVLPNGQRLFIGSIISAIPFLPFEVNVPDTIAWIYNGISGIIGGIGQRLPFRPRPSTESPEAVQTQEPITSVQETNMKFLPKLKMTNRLGMPILMLPVAQAVPVQLPIQV